MHSCVDLVSTLAYAFLLTICGFVYRRWSYNDARLPPGPAALPFVGNAHQLPAQFQHKTFTQWGKVHGDLVFARLFKTPALIISSLAVAQDLMEKRSMNYSGRPPLTLLVDLCRWDNVLTHMTYGERFRKHRRWIHDAFLVKDVLVRYRPIQRREVCAFLSGILATPEQWPKHVKRFSAATILEVAYGHRVTSSNDELINIAERATTETTAIGSAGATLIDFVPALKYIPSWMPGGRYKIQAAATKINIRKLLDTPYYIVKGQLERGTARPSFAATLLEQVLPHRELTYEDEDDIKGAAGVLFGAASDTTTCVVTTFFLAMTLYPDVYYKAQQEIDSVMGSEFRLLDFDDRQSLPYVDCLLQELYRWNPAAPMGLPHSVMRDDKYGGYHIPAESIVIPNIWGMMQNEDTYPEPETFRPERFMNLDQDTAESVDPRNAIFGFGRRICPGRYFADTGIWLLVVNVIATMNLTRARDDAGEEIVPPIEFVPGFVSHPAPFKCDIRPRSPKVQDLVFQWSVCNMN